MDQRLKINEENKQRKKRTTKWLKENDKGYKLDFKAWALIPIDVNPRNNGGYKTYDQKLK